MTEHRHAHDARWAGLTPFTSLRGRDWGKLRTPCHQSDGTSWEAAPQIGSGDMEAVAEEAEGGDFAQGLLDALCPEEVPPAFRRFLGS